MQDLLDNQEQEELIASLERDVATQTQKTKTVVGGGGASVALLFILSALYQAVYPWQLPHHAPFRNIIHPASVVVAELGAAGTAAYATSAVLAFGSRSELIWRRNLVFCSTLALFMFGFWATAIYKVFMQGNLPLGSLWRVLWRPFAPAFCVAAAVVLIDGLGEIRPELAKLHASKYNLKKA